MWCTTILNSRAFKSSDATLSRIHSKLDQILHDRGFKTPQDLDNKVREILTGQELEKYNQLKIL